MRKKILIVLACVIAIIIVYKITEDTTINPPVDLSMSTEDNAIKVKYTDMNGVKRIPIKVNGVSIDAIYDTGCSGMHMSLQELQTLCKNGQFDESDVIGVSYSQIANGDIVQNSVIRIREVEIGGENGIIISNIECTISLNENAPVLIGESVFRELASVEVDNIEETINFTPRK